MKKMTLLLSIILLASCTKTEIEYRDVEVPVETIIEKIVTQTVTQTVNVVTPPEEYSFTRNGVSTVYYSGQSARLKMATALKSAMNDKASTKTNVDNMFNNGTGFSDESLNSSGKKIGNKVGTSGSATVKPLFDEWITEFTTIVAPAVNNSITATRTIAGSYTEADGSRTVKVNAKGFELNQILSKGLIGALQVDQIINTYLSFTKLDGAKQDNDDDIYHYPTDGSAVPYITKMEHYWDEGFGYLQGLDNQYAPGLGDASIGRDGANLNYYLNKINGQEKEVGITKRIYDAFSAGRAAIVAKDYEERDRQANIIGVELSKVIGYKSQYYLRSAAGKIEKGEWADALHAIAEAYGFILGLQYTKAADGQPYLTHAEVNEHLSSLSAGDGGFWDRTPTELTTMADQLQQSTGLSE